MQVFRKFSLVWMLGLALGEAIFPQTALGQSVSVTSAAAPQSSPSMVLRRLARTTLDGALLPRPNEIVAGDKNAGAYLFVYGDPTLSETSQFFAKSFPKLEEEYITKGNLLVAYRPLPLTPLASTVAQVFRCLPRQHVFSVLKDLAQETPDWGQRPYDEAVQLLKEVSSNYQLSPPSFARCLKRADIAHAVHQTLERDLKEIRFKNLSSDLTFFVNGGAWHGYKMYPYVVTNIRVAIHEKRDFGEKNPFLEPREGDMTFGLPSAPRHLVEYALVSFAHQMPIHREGMDPRLRALIEQGALRYTYRPYHYFEPDARQAAIAAACVPKESFFNFWDTVAKTKDYWFPLDEKSLHIKRVALNYGATELCFRRKATADYVDRTTQEALDNLDVIRVSSFYYRGAQLRGEVSFPMLEKFIQSVDQARAEGRPIDRPRENSSNPPKEGVPE
jgi:protein-disulfide isomerase